ncbi:hypothetical protein Ciccas_014230 [Cichlidogyrus casuarinus]|uniref:Uncharacterized protein n=1 Tax=Cichlidogyrus casuarinus TaxID=1844966 RepID=A0ABD2PIR0_9PLAT
MKESESIYSEPVLEVSLLPCDDCEHKSSKLAASKPDHDHDHNESISPLSKQPHYVSTLNTHTNGLPVEIRETLDNECIGLEPIGQGVQSLQPYGRYPSNPNLSTTERREYKRLMAMLVSAGITQCSMSLKNAVI